MDNTVPADPQIEGIKEEFCIPLKDLKSFDTLNGILNQDKVKRMKMVAKIIFNVYVLDHLFYILAEGVLDRCWRFTKSSCWQCVDKINDVFYSSSVLSERAKSNQTTL